MRDFVCQTSSTYKWIYFQPSPHLYFVSGNAGWKIDVSGNFQHKCFCDLYSYKNIVEVKATALFGCQERHLFQSFSVEFPPLAARAVVCMDPATGLIAWVSSTAVRGDHPSCWETFVTCSAASVNMHERNPEMLLLL